MTLLHEAVKELAATVAKDVKGITDALNSVINDEAAAGGGNTWSIDKVKAHVEERTKEVEGRIATAFQHFAEDFEQRLAAHKQEVAQSIPPLPESVDLTAIYNAAKG